MLSRSARSPSLLGLSTVGQRFPTQWGEEVRRRARETKTSSWFLRESVGDEAELQAFRQDALASSPPLSFPAATPLQLSTGRISPKEAAAAELKQLLQEKALI